MAITRLQQARQMYAVGQLVSKTMDGSRPGYRGEDAYGGGTTAGGQRSGGERGDGPATGGGSQGGDSNAREKAIANQYKNLPTPTVTLGVDKFNNPIKVKTTYRDKRNRQKTLDALNQKGISSFDPRVTKKGINFLDPNNLTTSFAPTKQKSFGLLDLALIAASGGLFGAKVATGAKMFNTAKNISKFAQDIGLTDKNVVDSFTSNFSDKFSGFGKGKKSTTTTSIDEDLSKIGNGDGGLNSLGNMDALNQEYILLLNKFNSGNFTDTDQVRFTFLKNMLGK